LDILIKGALRELVRKEDVRREPPFTGRVNLDTKSQYDSCGDLKVRCLSARRIKAVNWLFFIITANCLAGRDGAAKPRRSCADGCFCSILWSLIHGRNQLIIKNVSICRYHASRLIFDS
jgi:hypothetical protein